MNKCVLQFHTEPKTWDRVSFLKPVLKPGFHEWCQVSFVNINIFLTKYYFIEFVYILNFFSNLLNKNLHKY